MLEPSSYDLHGSEPDTILLVDTDPGTRRLLELILTCQGFTVYAAASGQEAVDLYQEHVSTIALVLLDVQMPRLDGPATLRMLQAFNPDVAAIFLTGNGTPYEREELRAAGAVDVLTKPLPSAQVFVTQLRQAIAATAQPVG